MALPLRKPKHHELGAPHDLKRLLNLLEIDQETSELFIESIPFSLNDTTAGSETELQTVVIGKKEETDLPLIITESNYYKNIIKRTQAGDTPKKIITALEAWLNDNPESVWENSWVRFPRAVLNPYVNQIFNHDLLADKQNRMSPQRADVDRFIIYQNGEAFLRVPVSYLLKLSLADAISATPNVHPMVRATGERIMRHFLNDNTSPETFSFHIVPLSPCSKMGGGIARETLKRFLLTQLLTMYANRKFDLLSSGQRAMNLLCAPSSLTSEALKRYRL